MTDVRFITETGMFHAAVRVNWGARVDWFGFKPIKHRSPEGPGFIDRSDRSAMILHFASFDVGDFAVRSAISTVVRQYTAKTYVLAVRDCVSFAADFAREVGLRVPSVNITPYGFIQVLRLWNKDTAHG